MFGSIHLIFGPMFSGKTTELLRRVERYEVANRKCLVIKHKIDNRYSSDHVVAHNGRKTDAKACSALHLLDYSSYDVIAIDEGQFFGDSIVPFCESAANNGKIVIVAALDGTYQRKPFGKVLELVPLAESVVKLNSVCMKCYADAAFTQRLGSQEGDIDIGGAEKYSAACRSCYFKDLSSRQWQAQLAHRE